MARISVVLTILGQDRPGLVDSIAQTVAEHGGNWVESRMAHLAGQFAGILRVEIDSEQAKPLSEAIRDLAAGGLESVIHADPEALSQSQAPVVNLSLLGQDHPGIVRQISQVLAAHGVNVEELNTECRRAPNSGQELFSAQATLRIPAGVQTDQLRSALEQVAADLMVDVRLEESGNP